MIVVAALLGLSACGTDGDTGDTGDAPATPDAAPIGPADGPTYVDDVQPLLQAKCGPCHVSGGAGGVNHASSVADAHRDSSACAGQKVFECILVRVQDGSMPPGGACTGDPAADAGNERCLTAAEQDLLADWIEAGAPEGASQGEPDPDTDPSPEPDPY